MALAQYRMETQGVQVTRRIPAPKVATEMGWHKSARKHIPQVPDLRLSDWKLSTFTADLAWIHIEYTNSVGERAYLVIDRRVPSIG
jgi:hypothetical protein